jgi:serine/threonine protein kinase
MDAACSCTKQRMTICGTDEYMAPELMLDEDYGNSADVFSLGVCLLELVARRQAGDEGFMHRPAKRLFALGAQRVLVQSL